MLISKFDLYRDEWLDLVFDDRNKNYGAYQLRRLYAPTLVKAMVITFVSVTVACACTLLFKKNITDVDRIVHVTTQPDVFVLPPVKEIKKPEPPAHAKAPKPLHVATTRNIPPVAAPDPVAEKPVINSQITGQIGQETLKGDSPPAVEIPDNIPSKGVPGPAPDESVHSTAGLDFMPEPVGGVSAWTKFLNKNLRYPATAQEEGMSGKVWLSFIIEKDGHLSNIVIDKGAGYGFDEEALRVLKLAKAWKPGMQNGRPVRVKYSIPINFQLSE
ncbi:MAG TPA: TonB family protein [Mucilaginibacter sp.]|nr:TonB family protein [Mucilaginibacter sp.]